MQDCRRTSVVARTKGGYNMQEKRNHGNVWPAITAQPEQVAACDVAKLIRSNKHSRSHPQGQQTLCKDTLLHAETISQQIIYTCINYKSCKELNSKSRQGKTPNSVKLRNITHNLDYQHILPIDLKSS